MALERNTKDELSEFVKQFSFEVEFNRGHLIRFVRDGTRIDLWNSGTVGVYRNGTQEFYKKQSLSDLKELIANL